MPRGGVAEISGIDSRFSRCVRWRTEGFATAGYNFQTMRELPAI